jgi:Ca2+-binding RTX toxin-like protein
MHAFTTGGDQAAGFPKFHSGWVVFGPAVGDLDTDGKSEVVAATREGYLYVWNTDGNHSGNQEWWNYRHDERNTANYGLDTRPPGILRDAQVSGDGSQITFKAPGDDWYGGTADHYEAVTSGSPITPQNFDSKDQLDSEPTPGAAGDSQTYDVPVNAKRFVAIRAVDESGNLGPIKVLDRGTSGLPAGHCGNGIIGDDDPNTLTGTAGKDQIRGLGGDDLIRGKAGKDCVEGDADNDELHGGGDPDHLWGDEGDDEFFSVRGGHDFIHCGPGDDRVHAGRNDNVGSSCEHVTRGS